MNQKSIAGTILSVLKISFGFQRITKLKPLDWYRRRQRQALHAHLPHPWNVLGATGNGIGDAPFSFAKMPTMTSGEFEDFAWGELYDKFWHQGTIYAATPFAVQACMEHFGKLDPAKQETLSKWISDCLWSEEIGPCDGVHSGIWISKYDEQLLREAGIARPTVAEVLKLFSKDDK